MFHFDFFPFLIELFSVLSVVAVRVVVEAVARAVKNHINKQVRVRMAKLSMAVEEPYRRFIVGISMDFIKEFFIFENTFRHFFFELFAILVLISPQCLYYTSILNRSSTLISLFHLPFSGQIFEWTLRWCVLACGR